MNPAVPSKPTHLKGRQAPNGNQDGRQSDSDSLNSLPTKEELIKINVGDSGPAYECRLGMSRGIKGTIGACVVPTGVIVASETSIQLLDFMTGENVNNWTLGTEWATCVEKFNETTILVGTYLGNVLIIDVKQAKPVKTVIVSSRPLKSFFVTDHTIWILDGSSWLYTFTRNTLPSVDGKIQVCRVLEEAENFIVTKNDHIWATKSSVIEIHQHRIGIGAVPIARFDFISDMNLPLSWGPITALTSISNRKHQTLIMTGHESGQVVIWTTPNCQVTNSFYPGTGSKITSLRVVRDFLWIGYATGKIQIIKIGKKWELVYEFRQHRNPIAFILMTSNPDYQTDLSFPVVTIDSAGGLYCWDGFLRERFILDRLMQRESEFCEFARLTLTICTWNVDSQKPPKKESSFWTSLNKESDVVVIGLQEIINLESKSIQAKVFMNSKGSGDERVENSLAVQSWLDTVQSVFINYDCFAYKDMVGLLLIVMIRKNPPNLTFHHLSISTVKTGLSGYHGNKGSVAARLLINDSSFCFVNCHLAAGQSQVEARDADLQQIFRSTLFDKLAPSKPFFKSGEGNSIANAEHIFLFGDLNYRLDLSRSDTESLLQTNVHTELLRYDQLGCQRRLASHPLHKFEEAEIHFQPTYKYDRLSHSFDCSEKRRAPAYCDRILVSSADPMLKLTGYTSLQDITISDHRPVMASISVRCKSIARKKYELIKSEAYHDWLESL